MSTAETPDVTTDEVRLALNNPGTDAVSNEVLTQRIEDATVEVATIAHDGATMEQKRVAIRTLAAYYTLSVTGAAYTRTAQELDFREEYDVSAMIEDLAGRAENVRELITGAALDDAEAAAPGSPSLHTLGK